MQSRATHVLLSISEKMADRPILQKKNIKKARSPHRRTQEETLSRNTKFKQEDGRSQNTSEFLAEGNLKRRKAQGQKTKVHWSDQDIKIAYFQEANPTLNECFAEGQQARKRSYLDRPQGFECRFDRVSRRIGTTQSLETSNRSCTRSKECPMTCTEGFSAQATLSYCSNKEANASTLKNHRQGKGHDVHGRQSRFSTDDGHYFA